MSSISDIRTRLESIPIVLRIAAIASIGIGIAFPLVALIPGSNFDLAGTKMTWQELWQTRVALAILVRAILSWFRISRYNRLVILLYDVTDPVLLPLRRVIPPVSVIDITPLIAMIILYFIPTAFTWLIDLFI